MTSVLGSDIGGTFTDLIYFNEGSGQIEIEKVLTTPEDPSIAIETGMQRFDARMPGATRDIELMVHGTTLVINALLERKGSLTGLLTTKGFRDVLEIGTEKRYDGNDLQIDLPEPLAARPLRVEVNERMHVSGSVLTALDIASVEQAVTGLLKSGVQTIAVCLINSFANPEHEIQVGKVIEKLAPSIPITLSHEVLRELKEYERTTTTIANAYAKPLISKYLAALESKLKRQGFSGDLLLMQSSGGLNSSEHAKKYPIQILESGPAGGVMAAAHYAMLAGFPNALAFDMGGTTAKMCFIKNGSVARVQEVEVGRVHRFKRGSGIPVRVPVVDLMEIGAGGGSIANVSAKGTLEVGPESAGANPGPACYGLGGTRPTVSDADLTLGYLNAEYFLGAKMHLGSNAAERAIESVAVPLGLSVTEAAWGIHSVVNENMASAAKVYVAEKGEDQTTCAVVAFGGAGPVHACDLARRLGAKTVLVLPRAGVASAFGMLIAPRTYSTVRTHRKNIARLLDGEIEALFSELETEARAGLPSDEARSNASFERFIDMRYSGQGYDIVVPIPRGVKLDAGQLRSEFNRVYDHLYGRVFDGLDMETMNLRVTAVSPGRNIPEVGRAVGGAAVPVAERNAFCPIMRKFIPHKVYRRSDLGVGTALQGPVIIEEAESTTIVSTDGAVTVDPSGTLVVALDLELSRQTDRSKTESRLDVISLEMFWRKLASSVDELATALVRTSFSTVVRDVKDYACAIFDAHGRLLMQSSDSTPGIAGGLGSMIRHMRDVYPLSQIKPGDVFIGNDPWNGSGHHVDIFVITPAFHRGRLIGFAVSAAHHVDIGGRRATTESRDNYEEGLRIPLRKIFVEGVANEDVFAFIAANVRMAETVLGDLRAQFSANHFGADRLRELCEQQGWDDLQELADEIIKRSEAIARREISKIPDGVYLHEAPIAIIRNQTLTLKVAVTVDGDDLTVDFSGSSPQVGWANNCTLTYTAAYSTFAVNALLSLPVPLNHGSLSPIHVKATPGSVMNAQFPAPVFARTTVGNFIPEMIFSALASVMPDRVIAGCGSAPLWAQYYFGTRRDGSSFATLSAASGGLGARAGKDGLSCLTFPVNIGNTPVEILETELPILVLRRELWVDSAGPGEFRGGLGQVFELLVPEGEIGPSGPILIGFRGGRYDFAVPGILGGADGPKGLMVIGGAAAGSGGDISVQPGNTILCKIPGGGGIGDPVRRDRKAVRRDVEFGYLSMEHAIKYYGLNQRVPEFS